MVHHELCGHFSILRMYRKKHNLDYLPIIESEKIIEERAF